MAAFAQVSGWQQVVRGERTVKGRKQEITRGFDPQVLVSVVQNDDLRPVVLHQALDPPGAVLADSYRRFRDGPLHHQGLVARIVGRRMAGDQHETFRTAAVSPAEDSRFITFGKHPTRQKFRMRAFSRTARGEVPHHEYGQLEVPAAEFSRGVHPGAELTESIP